jgi:hypothetical protein
VRRISRSPTVCSGESVCASVVNDTINRALTRFLTRHSNEYRFAARLISHNISQALDDPLGLVGFRVVHQKTDLSFAQHSGQIGRAHLSTYFSYPALRCSRHRYRIANEENDDCYRSSPVECFTG